MRIFNPPAPYLTSNVKGQLIVVKYLENKKMIYRIYKIAGRIGTGMEKTDVPFTQMQDLLAPVGNQTSLAAFDNETNTIHIFNDKIIDVSTIVQKFKNHCDLPNNHQFSILRK